MIDKNKVQFIATIPISFDFTFMANQNDIAAEKYEETGDNEYYQQEATDHDKGERYRLNILRLNRHNSIDTVTFHINNLNGGIGYQLNLDLFNLLDLDFKHKSAKKKNSNLDKKYEIPVKKTNIIGTYLDKKTTSGKEYPTDPFKKESISTDPIFKSQIHVIRYPSQSDECDLTHLGNDASDSIEKNKKYSDLPGAPDYYEAGCLVVKITMNKESLDQDKVTDVNCVKSDNGRYVRVGEKPIKKSSYIEDIFLTGQTYYVEDVFFWTQKNGLFTGNDGNFNSYMNDDFDPKEHESFDHLVSQCGFKDSKQVFFIATIPISVDDNYFYNLNNIDPEKDDTDEGEIIFADDGHYYYEAEKKGLGHRYKLNKLRLSREHPILKKIFLKVNNLNGGVLYMLELNNNKNLWDIDVQHKKKNERKNRLSKPYEIPVKKLTIVGTYLDKTITSGQKYSADT